MHLPGFKNPKRQVNVEWLVVRGWRARRSGVWRPAGPGRAGSAAPASSSSSCAGALLLAPGAGQPLRPRAAGAPVAMASAAPGWRLRSCPLLVSSGDSEAVLEAVLRSDTYMAQARSAQVFLLPLFAWAVWDENLHSSGLRPQINMQPRSCDRWRWGQWRCCPACSLLGWTPICRVLERSV